ncbi:hypothetical protein [Lentibacillus sp. CBA3610]|uniref:hypothetical protein n=1 Tax=Lentibacillus sp. CBA3610 TaxID=2518176 RepID=UPI00350E3695
MLSFPRKDRLSQKKLRKWSKRSIWQERSITRIDVNSVWMQHSCRSVAAKKSTPILTSKGGRQRLIFQVLNQGNIGYKIAQRLVNLRQSPNLQRAEQAS